MVEDVATVGGVAVARGGVAVWDDAMVEGDAGMAIAGELAGAGRGAAGKEVRPANTKKQAKIRRIEVT